MQRSDVRRLWSARLLTMFSFVTSWCYLVPRRAERKIAGASACPPIPTRADPGHDTRGATSGGGTSSTVRESSSYRLNLPATDLPLEIYLFLAKTQEETRKRYAAELL